MNDCPNAEIRDRLPDLLHERLEVGVRAQVMAHVDRCAECQAELALLREAHAFLAVTPRVDVGRIVRGLPSPAMARAARAPTRSRWLDWRVAASIVALAVGGASIGTWTTIGKNVHVAAVGSVATAVRGPLAPLDSAAMPSQVQTTIATTAGSTAAGASAAAHSAVTELATGDGLSDMSAADLQALLGDIEHMQAVPPAEPDSVIVTGADAGTSEDN